MSDKITIYSDGGARGNPGPAAIGAVIEIDGKMWELSEVIGKATNNVAEYQAIIKALEKTRRLLREKGESPKKKRLDCFLDSELIVRQLKGEYRVKDAGLKRLFEELQKLKLEFRRVDFFHVKREFNKRADWLVNKALGKSKKN